MSSKHFLYGIGSSAGHSVPAIVACTLHSRALSLTVGSSALASDARTVIASVHTILAIRPGFEKTCCCSGEDLTRI